MRGDRDNEVLVVKQRAVSAKHLLTLTATRVCLRLNPSKNRIKTAALTTEEARENRIKTAALTTEAGA